MLSRLRCLLVIALTVCATSALAGTLASDPSVYFGIDPHIHIPRIWNGSSPYAGTGAQADLSGHVEWAVYGPGTFPAGFSGYLPDPTHFVYAYQVFETGSTPVSLFALVLDFPAFDIGSFTGSGVSGEPSTSAILIPLDSATWEFASVGPGETSVGLAFSSPFQPKISFGVVTAGNAEVGPVFPVATPTFVPGPSTAILAATGLVGLAAIGWRRKRGCPPRIARPSNRT